MSLLTNLKEDNDNESQEYVTVKIFGQTFGIEIEKVEDVFIPEVITEVPLSDPEIAGVLNLRGRIVTAIDMRKKLNLPDREDGVQAMAVGIADDHESYGLLIDNVGEVLRLGKDCYEENPANLDPKWAQLSSGVHRLENELLIILDVKRILKSKENVIAA